MLTSINIESLVKADHPYRKINKLLELKWLAKEFQQLYSTVGAPGIAIETGLRSLILQFMEDYSDRQMETALRENLAVKWFCGYELTEATPDHSYFGRLRARLGTQNVAKVFNHIVSQLEARGLVGKAFSMVDSTAIITKTALWEERDRALLDGLKKLNNAVVSDYAVDTQARFGAKNAKKVWFGYKRHHALDMKQGVITKVAVTAANVTDAKGLKHVCPKQGMVIADKAYSVKPASLILKAKGCHDGTIKARNRKNKNKDKDRFLSKLRMPYEGQFAHLPKRARYRGIAKVQMQAFFQAISHNLKRWVVLITLKPDLVMTG